MNVAPASNVQAATVAAFLSALIEHVCTQYGYAMSPDMEASLPAVIAIVVAHLWDMFTGENSKPQQVQQQQSVNAFPSSEASPGSHDTPHQQNLGDKPLP